MSKGNINGMIANPCLLSEDFFYKWLEYLTPIHRMTSQLIAVASEILKYRYTLSKSIKDDAILDDYLLSNIEIRDAIIKKLGISISNYHVTIGKLKKAGFLIDRTVNPKYIPKIPEDANSFGLLIFFTFKDVEEKNLQKGSEEA